MSAPESARPSQPSDAGDIEAALAAFAARLDSYAGTLSDRDRRLLDAVLYRSMTPLQRARARGETSLLAPEERDLLDRLGADPA